MQETRELCMVYDTMIVAAHAGNSPTAIRLASLADLIRATASQRQGWLSVADPIHATASQRPGWLPVWSDAGQWQIYGHHIVVFPVLLMLGYNS